MVPIYFIPDSRWDSFTFKLAKPTATNPKKRDITFPGLFIFSRSFHKITKVYNFSRTEKPSLIFFSGFPKHSGCRAMKYKGMVFVNTWVYSKNDTRHVHTGWWSLVN